MARDAPGMADIDSSFLLFCKEIKETYDLDAKSRNYDYWCYVKTDDTIDQEEDENFLFFNIDIIKLIAFLPVS